MAWLGAEGPCTPFCGSSVRVLSRLNDALQDNLVFSSRRQTATSLKNLRRLKMGQPRANVAADGPLDADVSLQVG